MTQKKTAALEDQVQKGFLKKCCLAEVRRISNHSGNLAELLHEQTNDGPTEGGFQEQELQGSLLT